jgi:hypothetical protein
MLKWLTRLMIMPWPRRWSRTVAFVTGDAITRELAQRCGARSGPAKNPAYRLFTDPLAAGKWIQGTGVQAF